MLFSESTDKITVTKGVLTAQCKKADNKTVIQSTISLNDYIGNVDGKLTWGGRGFSHTAEDVSVTKGVLSAKLKNQAGNTVESKLDLNQHIRNTDGVLEVIPVDVVKAPELLREVSTASTASSASAASASSMFSASSSTSMATSVSTSSVTKTSSSSYFSSSKFRSTSKVLLIEETCTKLELKGTVLHADLLRLDGSVVHAHIDLDGIIGFVDGRLVWDQKGFSKHCFEYALDGFFLVVKYRLHAGEQYHIARIDLRERLRNQDGVFILIELNAKLSVMLSEVPWMKFKVIAEPDLSLFATHPVMQETLVSIAETTVEHVTRTMHEQLTIAMETAIQVVTASAMRHVSEQMQTIVAGATTHAMASPSITAAEHLSILGAGAYAGLYGRANGHAHWSGGVNGHVHVEKAAVVHTTDMAAGAAKLEAMIKTKEVTLDQMIAEAPPVATKEVKALIDRRMGELKIEKCQNGFEYVKHDWGYACTGGKPGGIGQHKISFQQLFGR